MFMSRRSILKSMAAGAAVPTLSAPYVRAQASTLRLGFMTIRTGQMAAAGANYEQGLSVFLKQRSNKIGDRPVELFAVDTTNNPAVARSKAQELVESRKVHAIIGPISAFEALAISDYIKQAGVPMISSAGSEDLTQRDPNPWLLRPGSSCAQCSHPLADYAFKRLGHRRISTIGEDNAYGYEQTGGFHRVFEELGGKIIQKQWVPTASPDYATYIASIKPDADALFMALAGPNGFRFLRQAQEYGLNARLKFLGGYTAVDESFLRNMGEEAVGAITSSFYSSELENEENKRFVADIRRDYDLLPGYYAAVVHLAAAALDNAVRKLDGEVEDRARLMKTMRTSAVANTIRGPLTFDDLGNAIGNVYIRNVVRVKGKLVNSVVETYENVSQFWSYKESEFLKNPVYSRDFPASPNI
ncbi:ABC transporter substrate-binding protein [Bradyrhizobium sp. 187]|uniref:ABC transporter substrate-binding protein n=1 Tax=Bradyrhizobium sp. 187 TaxID=2782655 RepID=UPI001FFFA7E8|nr:ABC transporter substrate-binding protein [Bradyrhizobium sp. 187]UPJ71857.1 ABC transporter substrate-binding protein [Bradyrhizobium sp. 187]